MYGTTQTKITSFQWKTYALLYFMSLCFAFPFLWYEPFCCACQPTMLVLLVLNQVAKVSHFLSFLKYVIMENLHRIFLCAHSTTVYNSISVSAQNYITHIHRIANRTAPFCQSHCFFARNIHNQRIESWLRLFAQAFITMLVMLFKVCNCCEKPEKCRIIRSK